ncbi:MAG: hypothetical protein KAT66_08675 [Candidatus Lokiarchaeota archaeon]|nr:hypothetical protein [Candidatus Lokiarchaeota archaeon]
MTHSLHRKGNIEDLKRDYVILAMLAAGINDKYPDSRKKLIRIGEILNEHKPINIISEVAWKISPIITATFTDVETVNKVMKTLKEENLGVSIVISGLLSEIQNIATKVDLNLHTVHLSLGTFGKKELLPSEKILEITTMCGHHCISSQSIEYYVQLIKNGNISVEEAAKKLARPCVCGIFNLSRAVQILNTLVE